MRCKACNKTLNDNELMSKNKNGDPEELCRTCINSSYSNEFGPVVGMIDVPLLDTLPNGPGSFDN